MNQLVALISSHPVIVAGAAYWVFSNAVGTLPAPSGKSPVYAWAYAFLHVLAANLPRLLPQLRLGNSPPAPPPQK